MDEEAVKALKTWLDEGKAPDDFRRVNGWSKESFEEILEFLEFMKFGDFFREFYGFFRKLKNLS